MSDPGVAELAHDLRLACMRVSRRVRFESAEDTAPHQFSVLARLDTQAASVGDLADLEQVRAPSMSRTVAGLEGQGLVRRDGDPADGRVARISLTEAGRRTLQRERARRDAWMAERLEGLAEADRDALRAATVLLDRVLAQ
ncbi:MAG: MarR family transcriptional regulator [Ornithinimicrobium sp.]